MELQKYSRIVIWGLRNVQHSHRYIHAGFAESAARCHPDVAWVDDVPQSADAVADGSLVISSGMCAEHLPVVRGASYVLHNADAAVERVRESAHWVILQVWTKEVVERSAFTSTQSRNGIRAREHCTRLGGRIFREIAFSSP